jgi:hypothetical protein
MKSRAQRAQQRNRPQVSPTGTTCLIWKAGHLEHILKRFGARSCFPCNTFYSSTDSAGIREFRRIPQELTGIPELTSEFTGICLQFTIRLDLKCTYFM